MKILYVITGLGMGGAETQLSTIAQHMAKSHDVRVCYLTGEPVLLKDISAVPIVPINIKKTLSGFFQGYFKLRKLVADFKPDVIHSHMIHANILSRLLRLSIAVPKLVCSAHNSNEGGWLRMLAYRLTDRLADVTTNVSLEAVHAFETRWAIPKDKMRVVFNGVDTSIFKPDSEKRFYLRQLADVADNDKIILSVGRLTAAKDFPNLLNAFAGLSHMQGTFKLWIVGDGDDRLALTALVEKLNLTGKVFFWGMRSDVASFYNAADIYVLSSAWEGFGLVVAEAMASERVVVATDCGGVREVIGDQGFLVPVKNADALMQGMEKALSLSAGGAKVMGEQARTRVVENFSLDSVIENWLDIYEPVSCVGDGCGK